MKIQFEFTIDKETGEPVIQFTHQEKSNELEQKLLNVFINKAKKQGLMITDSLKNSGTGINSFDNYEIKVDDRKVSPRYIETNLNKKQENENDSI